jgi:transcriptional regulator with XRE-family HTH domain
MPETFGARLRQRRERAGIALAIIAEQTKINVALLEGLERDDVSRWPSGIFSRAFIRGYAHAIGLEPEVVVREFLELYPDPADTVATDPAEPAGSDGTRGGAPATRLRCLIGSAFGSFSVGPARTIPRPGSVTGDASDAPRSPKAVAPFEPDLAAAAQLCTALGRANAPSDLASLLPEAARILDAVGLIVWVSDPQAIELRPLLGHGYPEKMVTQLPAVPRDADNATAAAFRLAQTCVVDGRGQRSGALVVPLMTRGGCVGVLAIELPNGLEQTRAACALATIFAAQLATWIGAERSTEVSGRRLA